MSRPIASITRAATRTEGEPLNILTFPTHERTESNLARTGHNFYAYRCEQVKDWDRTFSPVPPNYMLLSPHKGTQQIPAEVDFDLVLSQNKFGQFQIARQLAGLLHLPLVSLEHTLPHPSWPQGRLDALKGMRGDVNVFISEFSRGKWGWGADEAEVIRHGVDSDTFSPNDAVVERKAHVLSVVNELRERDWCCGYQFWEKVTQGLPRLHLGKSPDGWSQPARSVPDLVRHYRECAVFVDTASASPIPSVVLEAMACGCVVVSRGNAMVPEIITDGVNGFICEDEASMRKRLEEVLSRPGDYASVRAAARQTILEKCSLARFVQDWDRLLRRAAEIVYTGE